MDPSAATNPLIIIASQFTLEHLNVIAGPMVIGLVISSCLFGLTTLQTYFYFINYPKDRGGFKVLVGSLWALDLLQTIFIAHSTYFYLVTNYGNVLALWFGEWSLISEVLITIIVAVQVQWFFAHRVLGLTRSYVLAAVVFLMGLAVGVLGLIAVVKLFEIKLFIRLPEVIGFITATLVVMATNDLIITVILCIYLAKARTNFSETKSAIRTLILYTIETGLLTSVIAIADAACVLTMSNNWVFIGISFSLTKLYANSLLTILNSRNSLKNRDGASTGNKISTNGLQSIMVTTVRTQEVSSYPAKPIENDIPLSPMKPGTYGVPQGLPSFEYLPHAV